MKHVLFYGVCLFVLWVLGRTVEPHDDQEQDVFPLWMDKTALEPTLNELPRGKG